jgi:hypothetical protein
MTMFSFWPFKEKAVSNARWLATLRVARELAAKEGDKTHVVYLDADIERLARDDRMDRARAATRRPLVDHSEDRLT